LEAEHLLASHVRRTSAEEFRS
jgi:hypothetical protein